MVYRVVDFTPPLDILEQAILVAKQNDKAVADGNAPASADRYAGSEQQWDKQVMDVVMPALRQALDHNDQGNQFIAAQHKAAKKVMDEMEALVKKKGKRVSDGDVKVLQTGERSVERMQSAIKDDQKQLIDALIDYRGGWVDHARGLLKDKSKIEQVVPLRRKSIDENGKATTLRTRVDEYAVRLHSIVKTAEKLAGAAVGDDSATVKEFVIATDRVLKDWTTAVDSADNSLNRLRDAKPNDWANKKYVETAASLVSRGQTALKDARGLAKTMDRLLGDFKKVSAGYDGVPRQQRDWAVKSLVPKTKTLNDRLKKTEAVEVKVRKLLATKQ